MNILDKLKTFEQESDDIRKTKLMLGWPDKNISKTLPLILFFKKCLVFPVKGSSAFSPMKGSLYSS